MHEPAIARDDILVVDGAHIGRYHRRPQPPTAEFFEVLVPAREAAAAVVGAMGGWSLTSTDQALVTALVAKGAVVSRSYALMSLQLDAMQTASGARVVLPTTALTVDQPISEDVIDLIRSAYPPGHPDQEVGTEADIQRDLRRVLGGEWLGPLMPVSRIVLDGNRPVALAIVNRAPGAAPVGGPWLSEICREPSPAYRGLGAALLQSVIDDCRAAGEVSLSLAVTDGNPARLVYERLGFSLAASITKLKLPDPALVG